MRRDAGNFSIRKPDRAGMRRDHTGDGIDQRGLARTIGADDAVDLARIDHERHIGDGGNAAEANRERVDFKKRHRQAPWQVVWQVARSTAWRAAAPLVWPPDQPVLSAGTTACRAE